MHSAPTGTSASSPRRRILATLLGAGVLAAVWSAPALAVVVETRSGQRIDAERVYPTVTALVVVARDFNLSIIPNDEVASVDGEAYVPPAPTSSLPPSPVPSPMPSAGESPAPAPSVAPASATGIYPLRPGTFRTYRLTVARESWERVNRRMKPRGTDQGSGVVKEVVVGADPLGPAAMTETIIEQMNGKPAQESSTVHLIDPREDGYYLLGQTVTDRMLEPSTQTSRISIPPMVWPRTLTIGKTWTVGPFRHMDMYTAGRLQVVGRESVTVPAGTYPDAYRISGFLHVFGGAQHLRVGRLVMEHGTLETTTWFVPGLGPVKEEAKFHAHQNFFANRESTPEMPVVVEERTTRELTEFGLGK